MKYVALRICIRKTSASICHFSWTGTYSACDFALQKQIFFLTEWISEHEIAGLLFFLDVPFYTASTAASIWASAASLYKNRDPRRDGIVPLTFFTAWYSMTLDDTGIFLKNYQHFLLQHFNFLLRTQQCKSLCIHSLLHMKKLRG